MIKSQELGDPVSPTIIIPTRTWGAKCIAWGRWISRHTWISHTHTSTMRFLLSLLCSLFASCTHAHKCTHTPICFLQVEKQALVYKSCTQWRWRKQSTLLISGGQRHTSTPTYTHVSAGLSYTKHLLPGIWTLSSSPVSCASVSLNLYLKVSVCLCVRR